MEYTLAYKDRNCPSDVHGPNVALTVVHQGEYFQFYIALFPSAVALDLVAAPGPHPDGVGIVGTWHLRALESTTERDIREGHQPDPDDPSASTQVINPYPARVKALERGKPSPT